jgi:DNA-binding beta-propeller fold protein YncE
MGVAGTALVMALAALLVATNALIPTNTLASGNGTDQTAPQNLTAGPYKVLKTAKVGGAGGFDYVYADADGRRLYIPRTGRGPQPGAAAPAPGTPVPASPRVTVFDLDTLVAVGEIPNTNARGAAVDPKSGHGFASSNPIAMWDTKTLALIKTIDVQGGPDGILFDPFNARVWIFSHRAPNATVINAADGTIAGTVDLGGSPEQAVTDGMGHIYVDVEDKNQIAAVDAKTLTVTATFDVSGKCGEPGGLAFDVKNHVLFASCHMPANMVILSSVDGKILDALPIGNGTDGATFNPATMEAFSSNRDGTLTVIKENSPTSFVVEQNVQTMVGAKTLTLDSKTGHIVLIAAEYMPAAAAPAAPQGAAPMQQQAATAPPAAPGPSINRGAPEQQGQRGGGQGGRGPQQQMVPDSFTILVVGK